MDGTRGHQVTARDVISGRGKFYDRHPGNCKFLSIISFHLDAYEDARNRHKEKAFITRLCVEKVRAWGGIFLKENDGVWMDIGEKKAKEKVSHAIRDALATRRRNESKRHGIQELGSKKVAHKVPAPIVKGKRPKNAAKNSEGSAIFASEVAETPQNSYQSAQRPGLPENCRKSAETEDGTEGIKGPPYTTNKPRMSNGSNVSVAVKHADIPFSKNDDYKTTTSLAPSSVTHTFIEPIPWIHNGYVTSPLDSEMCSLSTMAVIEESNVEDSLDEFALPSNWCSTNVNEPTWSLSSDEVEKALHSDVCRGEYSCLSNDLFLDDNIIV